MTSITTPVVGVKDVKNFVNTSDSDCLDFDLKSVEKKDTAK